MANLKTAANSRWPVAGDRVEYLDATDVLVTGVLAEVTNFSDSSRRARVCDTPEECQDKNAGLDLDYCRLRRIAPNQKGDA